VVQSQLRADSSWAPILKKPITKKGWQSGSSSKSACLPSLNHSATKKLDKKHGAVL
jgi:hypothetical protein